MRRFIRGPLGAAIALIAVLVLPSIASAHTGHHHASAKAAVAEPAKAAATSAALTGAEARSYTAQKDTSASVCGGAACCGMAHCATCCFLSSGGSNGVEPVWTDIPLPWAESRALGGIDPQDLSRPPKPFAFV